MSEISQEEARANGQIAALLALNMEWLAEVADSDDITLAELKWQVADFKKKQDEILNDKEHRERQYGIGCFLAQAAGTLKE